MADAVQLATARCRRAVRAVHRRRRGHLPGAGHGHGAALPVVRIVAPEGNYDYQNKYFTDDTSTWCPSGLPPGEEREIQRLVRAAYRALGCRGWGRADVMIDAPATASPSCWRSTPRPA
jgi:D-alanine-D-alanine ligase-like ATP-grasp enzyme